MKITLFIFLSLALSYSALAAPQSKIISYYGQEFYQALNLNVQDQDLKEALSHVLWSYHQKTSGGLDQIVSFCDNDDCYTHVNLGYDRSRIFLMGNFYLSSRPDGSFALRDVYCDKDKVSNDFKKGLGPGPGLVPNGAIINIEHTWPQSRFSHDFDDDMQKSDMHHLFPADTRMNAARANLAFGVVDTETQALRCSASRIGKAADGKSKVFEPPQNHRGNVARALFYFSVNYNLPITDEQEATLRQWHLDDPVDEEEILRNDAIQNIQGNRNPFIDYPELVDRISNF